MGVGAYIERALEIPQQTLMLCYITEGSVSPELEALLNMVYV